MPNPRESRMIETLRSRAADYRDGRALPDPYCYEVQDAWLAGYRAALAGSTADREGEHE